MLAAGAAFFLLVAACAPPPKTVANLSSPTPSPSPTPTAPLTSSTPSYHVGEVGVAYAPVAITPGGGVAPYTWSLSGGVLPGGLTLGTDGSVSGTPTTAGSFSFTIKLADSGDSSASIRGHINVASHVQASLLPACALYCNVELGCTDACGVFGTLAGGVAPYSYAVTQGPLPAGTALSTLSLTGTFSGQPGWLQFSVQVTDALGATSSVSPKFYMYPHISLSSVTCGNPNSPGGCKVAMPYSGGTPAQQIALNETGWSPGSCGTVAPLACPQPTGFAVTYQPGQAVVTVTFDPKFPFTYGVYTVWITSTDLCGPGAACTFPAKIVVNG